MKAVGRKPRITLKDWDLYTIQDLHKTLGPLVLQAASEAIIVAFEDEQSHCYFPIEYAERNARKGDDGWCGPQVTDPLTLYVCIAIGKKMETLVFKTSLRESVQSTMKACRRDGSYSHGLSQLAAALHALAAEMEEAVRIGQTK